jgi:tryptophan-rich sensory protein
MVLKIDYKVLLKNIAIPLLVGIASGLLTQNSVESFNEATIQPPFAPPGFLFPIVWTVLYILMGISAYLVETTANNHNNKTAQILYLLQLFFNFCWSFIFFTFEAYSFAFIWIIILLALIIATAVEFYKINKVAGLLMLPYIIWVSFAAILNLSIALLN